MPEYRYKAFISYSHHDEPWGRWLQRSLESYRVPRRLVGGEGRFGPVAARVAPVFRDREDLSSASDLTASVREELAASETMVVICSPAGAASPWVNEEVRHFRELGRGERILALIVDGDPQSGDPEARCFPPALVSGRQGGAFEPLAADARKWADGRSLARLKLVAGILGLRLDDLRQRDMQRKHRLWMASAGGAMVVAVVTTVLAIVAINARTKAENRREQAENLVGYMVSDLQDDLQEVGRLDILQGMGGEVARYLQTLDPGEVTDTSLKQQALVWRHLGSASMDQWKLDESMAQFSASRDVLRELYRRNPQDIERVYELAQAEFWVGYIHLEKGEFDQAQEALESYLRYADRLGEMEPGNPEWLMEQSMAHGNIAALMLGRPGGELERALDEITASVGLNWRAIEIDPDNEDYVSEYGEALAWQADTLLELCDLGGALKARQENARIAGEAASRKPGNAALRTRHAYALTGLANVARQVGLTDYAREGFVEAAQILGDLHATDPTNLDLRWEELIRKSYIAALDAETSDPSAAQAAFAGIFEPMLSVLEAEEAEYPVRSKDWTRYRLEFAEVAWRAGDTGKAVELWGAVTSELRASFGSDPDSGGWQDVVVKARFLGWSHLGGEQEVLPGIRLDPDRRHISCEDRGLLLLQALVEGNAEAARSHAYYLRSRGYFEPGFVRVCRQYELCQG